MLRLETLLISPIFLLIVLLAVAFTGWLFAVKLFSPSDRFWRISHFLGLFFASLGIFGILKDSRRFFYEREYYKCQKQIEAEYRWRLKSNLNEGLYCRKFIKTEFGPSNIDMMQQDYDLTCQWIKDNKMYIYECYYRQIPIINDSILFPKAQLSDVILKNYFSELRQCINDYNNDISKLEEYEEGLRMNDFEVYYLVFSTLFIAIGLGWEFVKFFARR